MSASYIDNPMCPYADVRAWKIYIAKNCSLEQITSKWKALLIGIGSNSNQNALSND